MEFYIGQILLVGFNFAPTGTMPCDGRLLSIAQYSALFSLLGTTYGGNGVTTFALPDLRGRMPINQGQGPGLSDYAIGEAAGSETVTLTTANLPAHNHVLAANSSPGTGSDPTNSFLAGYGTSLPPAGPYASTPNTTMAANAIQPTGNGSPVSIMSPFLTMNYVIVTEGIFPSRS